MAINQVKNQHLLWRAAFGPMAENADKLDLISQADLYKLLVKTSAKKPQPFVVANNLFDGVVKGVQDVIQLENLSKEQKQMMRAKSRDGLKTLNLLWLDELINSEAQLREKMSLFWHGHFACRVINIYFQQQLINTIRENALGNFGDLLRDVSKSPAMLSFLNNQQNKKQHPNENFAREVMELFTLGRGNYTEQDIKEAARAFTGWGFNGRGEFVNRPFLHDNGSKTIFGKTGNFNGDDVIDLLLERKETAVFIAGKIYKYFVNTTPDNNLINELANDFYQSGYNIQQLMQKMFTASWFYKDENIGTKIKSPIELLAGIRRFIPIDIENEEIQLLVQRSLGQVLFYPPNVAGWPGGKNWIDSSSLMFRLTLPYIITGNTALRVKPKDDDDAMMGMPAADDVIGKGRAFDSTVKWQQVENIFREVPHDELLPQIALALLQNTSAINLNTIQNNIQQGDRAEFIKTSILKLMSTPEYQLC